MDPIVIGVAAFLGGIISAVLGWLDSGETFDARKLTSSIIRALVAGIVFAVGYEYAGGQITIIDIFVALVAGAGIDAGGNRIAGAIKAGLKKE